MTKIVGNVRPEDDYTHPLGPEPNFNESVYFNFFDRDARRGGFLRIGNRANEGYAELTVIVYEPDGSALFNYKRPAITTNDGWNAGGLSVEVLVPGEKLRTKYDGSVVYLADPRAMHDPGKAFKENPHRRLAIDLVHEGVGPLYGHVGKPGDGNEFARAHFEQHMKVSGTLAVDGGAPVELRGHGLRDHSWGPRYWQAPWWYRWLTANFGADFGFVVSIIASRDGGRHYGGMVLRDGAYELIRHATIETEWTGDDQYHVSIRATATTDAGSYEITGRVLNLIPLRNRRETPEGEQLVTRISEGMTEWSCNEMTGYGLSEYLDQLVDGRPVGAAEE